MTTTVRTSSALLAARDAAEKTPGMKVSLVKGKVYRLNEPLYWRGVDVELNGNDAIVEANWAYTGQTRPGTGEQMPGVGVYVVPLLGSDEPWSADKIDGYIWMNEPGGAGKYDPDPTAIYKESAPVQYPGLPADTYTIARKVLIPCENITIRNLTIRRKAGDIPMLVCWANGATVENVTADATWTKPNLSIEGSTDVLVRNVNFAGVQFNSSTRCGIEKSTAVAAVSFEERTRECFIRNCINLDYASVNDPTCANTEVIGNTFDSPNPYPGVSMNIVGADGAFIAGNTCAAPIGTGPVVKRLILAGNTAKALCTQEGAEVTQYNNSWQK